MRASPPRLQVPREKPFTSEETIMIPRTNTDRPRFGCPVCGSEDIQEIGECTTYTYVTSWTEDGEVEEYGAIEYSDDETVADDPYTCRACARHGEPDRFAKPIRLSLYHLEFPIEYHIDRAIPEGWTDLSWHNDVCPSFVDERTGWRVWVHPLDPQDREGDDYKRFALTKMVWDITFEWQQWADVYTDGTAPAFDTWDEVLGYLAAQPTYTK